MIAKNQFLIVFVISLSLLIGNGEAGWKFWKKEKETTTTTTLASINVQSIATPIPDLAEAKMTTVGGLTVRSTINTGAAVIGAANPGLAVGASTTGGNIQNNARFNRPNPGTEVGLDIVVPRPNRPGIGGGNNQNYRDWAVDLTGAGEHPRNPPPKLPARGPPINSDGSKSRISEVTTRSSHTPTTDPRSTAVPDNAPIQPTQPSRIAASKPDGTPQQTPLQSTSAASRPHSVQPHVTSSSTTPSARITQHAPSIPSSSNSGKSWADVAAGGSRSISPTELPRQPVSGGSERATTQSSNRRPMSPGGTSTGDALASAAGAVGAAGVAGAIGAAGTTTTSATTKKVYSSNPTYSKGNTVTDEDLEKLSEALYIKETNNANRYITINLQKQTTSNSPTDQASQPLLAVNPEAFQIPTVQRILSIFDNYQLDSHTNEYISPAQRQEESLLVDTFLSTNVMSAAMRFLADKGFVRQDYYEYKDTLRRIWFNLFSRGQGKIGSTGFEHVFMAETRQGDSDTEVLGLHNWIYFNAEEVKRHVDYLGYIKKIDLGDKGSIVKIHAKFNGHNKPVTTIFVGTSPELEMALYTVCFYTRPDGKCPVSLGGTKFDIITYKFRYRGKDLMGTAYPEI